MFCFALGDCFARKFASSPKLIIAHSACDVKTAPCKNKGRQDGVFSLTKLRDSFAIFEGERGVVGRRSSCCAV